MKHSFTLLTIATICQVLPSAAWSDDSPTRQHGRCQIAILCDDLPGSNTQLVRSLSNALNQGGFQTTELSATDVCDKNKLSADKFFLYVIPNCRSYPAAGLPALANYAEHRGHILFLGGPFLDDPLWRGKVGWLNKAAVTAIRQNAQPTHMPFPNKTLDATAWKRTCNDPTNPSTWDLVPDGPQGEKCFHFTTRNFTGWDGYASPTTQLFGPQHDLFTFTAKGDPNTPQIAVEIQEQDGSRWIAVATLTPKWQRIVLDPHDFKHWPNSNKQARRGGTGDQLRPATARRVIFQLAQSHTAEVAAGQHAFWVADIGTCINPVAGMQLKLSSAETSFETIFPRYKVYPLHEPKRIQTLGPICDLEEAQVDATRELICAVPRTMGRGFRRDQKWRYIPLANAIDTDTTDTRGLRHRGSPAWLLLNQSPPYAGSVFASVGWNDSSQLATHPMSQMAARIASRLRSGLFLKEAGSEQFAYWPGEKITFGATIVNYGAHTASTTARMTVTDQQGKQVLVESKELTSLAAQETSTWQPTTTLPATATQTLQVTTELLVDDQVIDRIQHHVTILDTSPSAPREFMSVRGNDFYVNGHKWYPVGINYWPLYVSGMDRKDYGAGWIPRRFYDPELVEQDLQRMDALGINMVSIQAHDPEHYRNLLDFIHRCGRHNIYVNLFCGLASPIAFREEPLRAFVTTARLAENPVIMAYDTIWEPGNYVFRKDWRERWDRDWRRWIMEQYGSVDAAQADWQFKSPRDAAGRPVAPPDKYFRRDGPWRGLMAAYRRFMDDLMSRKWNQANRRLRAIDPNHLVSFRQGNTLPHDFTFTATAKHIDFICPEGYSIPNTEDGYSAAGFITKYVHFTTGGKPIVWSEFGQSVWDAQAMAPSATRIESVAEYHDLFYRMVLESGANGTIPWWWPGGYRVGERSDYGIMNRDGTPRPAARLISKYTPRLTAARQWPEPTTWFTMDRDAHAGGYWHVCFNTGRDAYRRAVANAQHLGVRSAGTGTTSADTPLVAVGNRPCTGKNPPKFLNAEFNWLQILDASGTWTEAHDGARIRVAAGKPIRARISVGNTQEATWLAPQANEPDDGDVFLQTTPTSQLKGQWPLPQPTPYLADADFGEIELAPNITQTTSVELRMVAHGRSRFGEARTFVLIPQ